MAALADQVGVSDRISRIGFVEGRQKDQLVSRAMLLVLPSHSENFGNVVLEAMAKGIPVIVTPEVGLAATVASTHSGIVASGDPTQLAGAIALLIHNAELRSELGRNGRIAARSLSWSRIAERMETEYLNLLHEHPR